MTKKLLIIFLLLLSLPTFARMLPQGIYSMQDFHYFRLVEFDKCIRDLQIPCRWAPDAGLGYGEPLFNFYGQGAYILGEVFHLVFQFSFINSLKLTFAFSLFGSAVAMFFLSKKLWKNNLSALVSSILYLYAPYRAVDVWVRGALPEALSFVLFPLIFLSFENYIEKSSRKNLLIFSFLFSLLIITHNLSVILFLPVISIWAIYRVLATKNVKLVFPLFLGALFSLFLSSFYVLPVLFESKFIDFVATTQGYFDFRGHFLGLSQILFSLYWGYGGSVFGPEDGLNLSVGYFQWIIPVFAFLLFVLRKKIIKNKDFFVLFAISWICLFLTHNKSTLIWENLSFMKFIQFPWRFLGVSVFSLTLASGAIVNLFGKRFAVLIAAAITVGSILLNVGFFKEDILYKGITDKDLTQGPRWEEQTRASIGDFWPKDSGEIPTAPSPEKTDQVELLEKKSNKIVYKITGEAGQVKFPVNSFPGWTTEFKDDGTAVLKFKNTPVRTFGNIISFLSLMLLVYFLIVKEKFYKNEN